MPPKKPKTVRQPGAAAADTEVEAVGATEPGESNIDAAIAAGQAGRTHKVAKAKPVVPPSKVRGDPMRAPEMPVNQKREMPYDEAMKLLAAGKLERTTLTEKGWVAAPNRKPPAGPQPVEG